MTHPVLCLMGPTAAGKSALALEIIQHFPCEIISVDSVMVYRGFDIGTAKPEPTILSKIPHHLIDIRDPKEPYSAGDFYLDVCQHIDAIIKRGRIPLLVGGTMMYFRVLQQGLAQLPQADQALRAKWQTQIEQEGLTFLHEKLRQIDPLAAKRIHQNDAQRIQRALEVFTLTGKKISNIQCNNNQFLTNHRLFFFSLPPMARPILHEKIAVRFQQMIELGLIDEVKKLFNRGDLSDDLPAIRAVGYQQIWTYLAGKISYEEMYQQALSATRQLAKRQLTWLRSWPSLIYLSDNKSKIVAQISQCLN